MSAILKFDFQKRKQLLFSEVNYLNYTKITHVCICDNYIFPKTSGNKNKQWTHSTPLKGPGGVQGQNPWWRSRGRSPWKLLCISMRIQHFQRKLIYVRLLS